MQFCTKCGAALNGAPFCSKCGAPAAQGGQQGFNEPQQFNNNQQQYGGQQGFNGPQQFNGNPQQQFHRQQTGGYVEKQGNSLNLNFDFKDISLGTILFFAGTLFAVVAALILLFTGLGNISTVSDTMKGFKMLDKGSGFDTFIFVVINFFGLIAAAGTVVCAFMINGIKNAKNNNIIGAGASVLMLILLIIFYIVGENVTYSSGGFSFALAAVVAEHMSGMVTFYILAAVAYAAGVLLEMMGINKISLNNPGGMNNGGFNNNGFNNNGFNNNSFNNNSFNNNGFNNNGFNNNGFNNNGFDSNGFNQNGMNEGSFNQDGTNNGGFSNNQQ